MGGILDKTKDSHEPLNQDAFVFWRSLKRIYEDPDNLSNFFTPFSVDAEHNQEDQSTPSNARLKRRSTITTESEAYNVLFSKGSSSSSSSNKSKITFQESPQAEGINQNMLATINCKLQLIPPELSHFTLNLDNHFISERLFLCICAAIIENNNNYANRHLATTLKDTPLSTMKKKKIQQDFQEYLAKYYFTITKLSLKNTLLSSRSLEALAQCLRHNRSIVELDLGGNDLTAKGIGLLISGLRDNKTITRLNLADVHAFDEGAFMVAAYLMCSKNIKVVDLASNYITDKGFQALKQSVMRNCTITSLYLSDNQIESQKLHSLEHLLARNTAVQYVLDSIFDSIPWNRKFKNRIASFKKGVMQTRSNSTLTLVDEDDKTPLFRLMNKHNNSPGNMLNGDESGGGGGSEGIGGHFTSPPETPSTRFTIGKSEMTGKRPTMEDRMVAYGCFRNNPNSEFYSIFDGHGGKSASDFAADNIYRIFSEYLNSNKTPQEAFRLAYSSINQQIAPWPFIGTTAASVYIQEDKVYVANVGDSRVILGKITMEGENKKVSTQRLTFDHRPVEESERQRIINAGGTVLNGRVNGMLAVSRALGDSFLNPYVTPEPFQSSFTITEDDKFLILACDGVWDLVSDEEAVLIISGISDPGKSSETLRDLAFSMGSTDNISVMVVKLNDY
ncbi:hypothetical protein CYY_006282 [Polysphondylium violaceum]|uniref:PPM-type phosphatase domain-containing protein n=1 Tax=Polysphondylium violaceum TaxID=133409 RepID=A0A8J4V3B0_9MYCE|nr:hypothetical protein CYY_006282 [Polysphondylium violaceum]